MDPVPPRELVDSIPLEMERICIKALSKRASDRYATADELADDLLNWQLGAQQVHHERRIVPRGLRSFDADDADFFLDLLPGPRDRDGLPESIRFWKTRLEETDPDQTFSVGLIYGPSGCGKSSLVKAGLLPRLAKSVVAIYVEATPDDTETRILRGLRKQLPDLPDQLGLVETFTLLRRGAGPKVVIVLDQFEQCLHAQRTEQDTALVNALRQCNGGRLQAVVMVRDDFAMAAARFMDSLDIRIVQGHNFATVDLFDVDHARKVLIKFGQAFGKLPTQVSALSEPEREFVSSVATGLADDGQVVSVRLALFAEMIKSKPWIPATLEEVGGTAGVGVTFLEETFASRSANPNHRKHETAAREVLTRLLPEVGTDIKGHMRSQAELMEAAGYQHRPSDFQDLLRILDGELRLITPTDPEGFHTESGGDASSKYYQFTHDYLVPSLQEWLTRKQKETPRGRAELLLADRAGVWNARPENRQLPSLAQWFQIRRFTQKKNWTPSQHKMMVKAGRHHAIRSVVAALLLAVVTFTGLAIQQQGIVQRNATHAAGLMDSLLKADIAQVPAVVSDLSDYRQWSDPLLRAKLAEATDGSEAKLHMALALLPVDDRQIDYLREQLPVCTLEELPVVRKALLPHQDKLTETLWREVQDESQDASRRFQTAAALAEYAPNDERWKAIAPFVAQHLTSAVSSAYLSPWRQLFQPSSQPLTSPLTGIHTDRSRSEKQREAAVFLLSDYLRDQPEPLVEVILMADELAEFSQLIAALKPHSAAVRQRLLYETQAVMPVNLAKTNDQLSEADQQLRDAHWKRQSLAAVTLVHLGFGDDVWSLLKFSPDPSLRSFIIHHLGKLGTNHNEFAARLEMESDVSIRRSLIQSLGGLDATRIPPADRSRIAERLQTMFINDPDPGIHGSASWTLRKWGTKLPELPVSEPILVATSPSENQPQQPSTSPAITAETTLRRAQDNKVRRWYVNGQGQTMVVIPAPADRRGSSVIHDFAISNHEVILAEYRRYRAGWGAGRDDYPTDQFPIHGASWYEVAEYCNWLSKQEGLPESQWVYEPNISGQFGDGVTIKENSAGLTGYRLPTDAEWEVACRAGTSGTHGFGEPLALLKLYCWHGANSEGTRHAVESLLPNDFGLFDFHGNLFEWVQNPVSGPMSPVKASIERANRGGTYIGTRQGYRSNSRGGFLPSSRFSLQGFRVARTLSPSNDSTQPTVESRQVSYAEAAVAAEASKVERPLINEDFGAGLDGWQVEGGAKEFVRFIEKSETVLTTHGKQKNADTGRLYQCFQVPNDATDLLLTLHGGGDLQAVHLALWDGPLLYRRVAAGNDHSKVPVQWNLVPLRGRVVTLEIVDRSTSPWGFIGVQGISLLRQNANHDWNGWPTDAPPPAVAPFDAEQARQHQEVWAKHLGVPVEYTNSLGMKFRLIPPGEFVMGSTPTEIEDAIAVIKAANPNDKYWPQFPKSEEPQHKVILAQPIYLGVHEVTQAQYEGVMGQNPSFFSTTGKGKDAVVENDTPQHPVEAVNWSDAAEFCARLSQQEKQKPFYFRIGDAVTKIDGTGYRLPTEAEWEFACRAGTTTKHWIGGSDDDLPQAGWFKVNSDKRTHTVGELKANPFGLYDVHGNVWEWVEDRWSSTYFGEFIRKPAISPTGPASIGSLRVIRGGSWLTPASSCRASDRHAFGPTFRGFDIGFRVVLPVDAVKSTLK